MVQGTEDNSINFSYKRAVLGEQHMAMNSREFIRVSGIGAMTLLICGCGSCSFVGRSSFGQQEYEIGKNL